MLIRKYIYANAYWILCHPDETGNHGSYLHIKSIYSYSRNNESSAYELSYLHQTVTSVLKFPRFSHLQVLSKCIILDFT